MFPNLTALFLYSSMFLFIFINIFPTRLYSQLVYRCNDELGFLIRFSINVNTISEDILDGKPTSLSFSETNSLFILSLDHLFGTFSILYHFVQEILQQILASMLFVFWQFKYENTCWKFFSQFVV